MTKKYSITATEQFVRIFQCLPTKPLKQFPDECPEIEKVSNFISEYLSNGFFGSLKGRNKPSWIVSTKDPLCLSKVSYAKKYNLHHYHIGIPFYDTSPRGDFTSQYILHYQKISDTEIKIIDLDSHPPFILPKIALINSESVSLG